MFHVLKKKETAKGIVFKKGQKVKETEKREGWKKCEGYREIKEQKKKSNHDLIIIFEKVFLLKWPLNRAEVFINDYMSSDGGNSASAIS